MPLPQPPQSGPSCTLLAPLPPPHALPPLGPHVAPSSYASFFYASFFYSAGGDCVQPAAELRHVQRHKHGVDVWGALRACPALSLHSLRSPCCLRHRPPHPTLPPAFPHVAPPPMLPLCTRQWASAFNQPLSFDTSNVTSMAGMFSVRSARALPSTSIVGPSLLLAPTTPPRPTACLPACRPSSYAAPFYSAVRIGVQPAAELRHVQCHRHGEDVSGALRARALPSASTVRGLPAACATDHPTPPFRLLARMSSLLLWFPFLLGS